MASRARTIFSAPAPTQPSSTVPVGLAAIDSLGRLPEGLRASLLHEEPVLNSELMRLKRKIVSAEEDLKHKRETDPIELERKKKKELEAAQKKRVEEFKLEQRGRRAETIYQEWKQEADARFIQLMQESDTPVLVDTTEVDVTAPDAEQRLREKLKVDKLQEKKSNFVKISAHIQTLKDIARLKDVMTRRGMTEKEWIEYLHRTEIMKPSTFAARHRLIAFLEAYPRVKYIDVSIRELLEIKAKLERRIEEDPREAQFWAMSDFSRFPSVSVLFGGACNVCVVPAPHPTNQTMATNESAAPIVALAEDVAPRLKTSTDAAKAAADHAAANADKDVDASLDDLDDYSDDEDAEMMGEEEYNAYIAELKL